ncbi:MAG: hypothetical protein R3276_01645 [Marinobacter sp.]|nr:hypothetical protein [Marinobacter sp.]
MAITSHFIETEFVVLSPDKTATKEPADGTLYQRLDETYNNFRGHELIACHEFGSDWGMWEMHPEGDEIVLLMSGDVTFVLQLEDGENTVRLQRPGAYVVVPKGIWHTARTDTTSKLLFITPGEATQHRDSPLLQGH